MTLLKIHIVYSLRMDTLIMEAINDLKEPGGSNKTAIGNYIEVLMVHTYIFLFSREYYTGFWIFRYLYSYDLV